MDRADGGSYKFQSLLASNAQLALGSDWPVSTLNLLKFRGAVLFCLILAKLVVSVLVMHLLNFPLIFPENNCSISYHVLYEI